MRHAPGIRKWRMMCVLVGVALMHLPWRAVGQASGHHHSQLSPGGDDRLPPLFEAAVHPDRALQARACAACNPAHPLGSQCCGMCHFRLNQETVATPQLCNMHHVGELLHDLREQGSGIDGFTPEQLLEALRGRTLWLIGDSQTTHWFDALECFMQGLIEEAARQPPLATTSGNLWLMYRHPRLEAAGARKEPPRPAVCIHLQAATRVCHVRLDRADELVAPVLRVLLSEVPGLPRDIAVVNLGLHYDFTDLGPYERDLHDFTEYVAAHRQELPALIWKDTAPQHFGNPNGYWTWSDGKPGEGNGWCRPLSEQELRCEDIAGGGAFNRAATPLMEAAGIPVLRTYNATLPLWNLHLRDGDCTHYCHPSHYELNTLALARLLPAVQLAA